MDTALAKTVDRLAEGDGAPWRNAYNPNARLAGTRSEARLEPPGRLTIEQQRSRIMADAKGETTKALTCEFCGRPFGRAQGLGSHQARCAKNPNKNVWAARGSKQRIKREATRYVEAAITGAKSEACAELVHEEERPSIADLRRRLISAMRAERDRLDRELAVLGRIRPEP